MAFEILQGVVIVGVDSTQGVRAADHRVYHSRGIGIVVFGVPGGARAFPLVRVPVGPFHAVTARFWSSYWLVGATLDATGGSEGF